MTYEAKNYFRIVQRAIRPIYFINELNSISYLSTATFVRYMNKCFVILACHSLNELEKVLSNRKSIWDYVGFIMLDGKFKLLKDDVLKFKIYTNLDIVVCELDERSSWVSNNSNNSFFNLDLNNDSKLFREDYFDWIGFPAKKADDYHRTKANPDRIVKDQELLDDGRIKWLNARFFTISAHTDYLNKNGEIKGKLITDKPQSLQGMSGGVFYCVPQSLTKENIDDDYNISRDYYFVGIGLIYDNKKNLISGVAKNQIISLLNNDFFSN